MNNAQLDMVLGYLNEGAEIDTLDFEMSAFDEGANLDMRAKYKKFIQEYKACTKSMKEAIKAKDKEKFESNYQKLNSKLDELEKDVHAIDSSAGSVIFGIYTWVTLTTAKDMKVFFKTLIPIYGPIQNLVYTVDQAIKGVNSIIDVIKNKKEFSADAINPYKIKLLANIKTMKEDLKKLKSIVKFDNKVE